MARGHVRAGLCAKMTGTYPWYPICRASAGTQRAGSCPWGAVGGVCTRAAPGTRTQHLCSVHTSSPQLPGICQGSEGGSVGTGERLAPQGLPVRTEGHRPAEGQPTFPGALIGLRLSMVYREGCPELERGQRRRRERLLPMAQTTRGLDQLPTPLLWHQETSALEGVFQSWGPGHRQQPPRPLQATHQKSCLWLMLQRLKCSSPRGPLSLSPHLAQVWVRRLGQIMSRQVALTELTALHPSLQWDLPSPRCSHATEEEAAQRGGDTYPRSHSWNMAETGWKPGCWLPCLPSRTLPSLPPGGQLQLGVPTSWNPRVQELGI